MQGGGRRAAKRSAVPEEAPASWARGELGRDGDRRRGLGRRRRPGSGATLWKLGSRMLEYHERPRSAYGKHRH